MSSPNSNFTIIHPKNMSDKRPKFISDPDVDEGRQHLTKVRAERKAQAKKNPELDAEIDAMRTEIALEQALKRYESRKAKGRKTRKNNKLKKKGKSRKKGNVQKNFNVYAREGLNCKKFKCQGLIQKKIISKRSTYFCNSCQK